jgi:hypothetical protein
VYELACIADSTVMGLPVAAWAGAVIASTLTAPIKPTKFLSISFLQFEAINVADDEPKII